MKPHTKLRKWRDDRSLSLYQASRVFCAPRDTLYTWETGKRPIPERVWMAIDAIARAGFSLQPIHYVYKLTDTNTGQFYYGSRTCRVDPANDSYTGHGVWKTRVGDLSLTKEIVSIHCTQADAIKAECRLFMPHKNNPLCVNGIPGQGWLRRKQQSCS